MDWNKPFSHAWSCASCCELQVSSVFVWWCTVCARDSRMLYFVKVGIGLTSIVLKERKDFLFIHWVKHCCLFCLSWVKVCGFFSKLSYNKHLLNPMCYLSICVWGTVSKLLHVKGYVHPKKYLYLFTPHAEKKVGWSVIVVKHFWSFTTEQHCSNFLKQLT